MIGSLALYKWPKRHDHCIEQCAALHVTTVLPVVDPQTLAQHRPWIFPELPMIRLEPRWGGVCWRWWFACSGCGRLFENLYRPPTAAALDWRCRGCHGLIYASQRYGYRHPLRKDARNWTQRKRRTAQKDGARQSRRMERQGDRQRRDDAKRPSFSDDSLQWASAVAEGLRDALAQPNDGPRTTSAQRWR